MDAIRAKRPEIGSEFCDRLRLAERQVFAGEDHAIAAALARLRRKPGEAAPSDAFNIWAKSVVA